MVTDLHRLYPQTTRMPGTESSAFDQWYENQRRLIEQAQIVTHEEQIRTRIQESFQTVQHKESIQQRALKLRDQLSRLDQVDEQCKEVVASERVERRGSPFSRYVEMMARRIEESS